MLLVAGGELTTLSLMELGLLLMDWGDGRSVAGDYNWGGGHSGDGNDGQNRTFNLQRLRVRYADVPFAALLLLLLLLLLLRQLVRNDHLGCSLLANGLTSLRLLLTLLLLLLLLLVVLKHRFR